MVGGTFTFFIIFTSICVVIEFFLGFFAPHVVYEDDAKCKVCYYVDINFYLALALISAVVEIILAFLFYGSAFVQESFIITTLMFFVLLLLAAFLSGINIAAMIMFAILGEYIRTKRVFNSLKKRNYTIIDEREEKIKKEL